MVETRHVSLRLTVEAADLLDQMAPSQNKRGQYISGLIMRAAQEQGLIEPPAPLVEPPGDDLAGRLAALEARVAALEQRE